MVEADIARKAAELGQEVGEMPKCRMLKRALRGSDGEKACGRAHNAWMRQGRSLR